MLKNLGPELGAQTVHSLAGVGVPQTASDFGKLLSPWTIKKWKKIDILVLDEIGMLMIIKYRSFTLLVVRTR